MTKVTVGSVPAEANSKGSLNASTPVEQRDEKGTAPESNGPVMHQTGAYLPAEYTTITGNKRRDR